MGSANQMVNVHAIKANGLAEIVRCLCAQICAPGRVNAVKVLVNVTKVIPAKIVLSLTNNMNAQKHVINVVLVSTKSVNARLDLKAKRASLSSVLPNVVFMGGVLEMQVVHQFAYAKLGILALVA